MEKQPGVTGAGADTGAGATAGAGGVGTKLKSAYHVIHGLGENVRGTTLGAVDTATNKGGSENDEIARKGRLEMEQGLAAFRQPKPGVGAPNASAAGHSGGATGGGGGTGPMGGAGSTQTGPPGQDPGSRTAPTFPTPQQNQPGVAGSNGYNAPPNYGDTRTHPGDTSTTTGAHGGPGATPGNAGATSTIEGRNGVHGQQHPATGATGQYPPGSQGHSEESRNRDPASGYHDARVDPQNGNQGHGGYGQTEKHTTEQFASRATSVPNRGASQMNDNNTNLQGQGAVEGRRDKKDIGAPVHHHRDDAVTDLNARPGEKHGDGQLSTANSGKIPDYDRNKAFDSHPGGQNDQGGDMRQQGLGQGQERNRGEMPGSYGDNANEGYKNQYEQ
ncbi:hypothetical protein BDZ94DRAFT_1273369 [Collybia nuda]|uniref:Uncharacterized protein n=1 Tax=Collybia nuda TaxID=64659 RepID=A0A9P5XX83_9AGAR|nr:hypothetical protein BDZ94DRAFT_1273369 [Collybia nuda]